jgi:hypothetical protein
VSSADIWGVLAEVVAALERAGLPYKVGGALASVLHGAPRSTLDVDLVAELTEASVPLLVKELGQGFYAEPEAIAASVRKGRSFNVIHLGLMFKVDIFPLKKAPYDLEDFGRRLRIPLPDGSAREVWTTSKEDIILRKLMWYESGGRVSERQWKDVRTLVEVHGERLDWAYLFKWGSVLNVSALLESARQPSSNGK